MSKVLVATKGAPPPGLVKRLIAGGPNTPGPWFRGLLTGAGGAVLISTFGFVTGGLATVAGATALAVTAWLHSRRQPK